jgi:hypothetical protein
VNNKLSSALWLSMAYINYRFGAYMQLMKSHVCDSCSLWNLAINCVHAVAVHGVKERSVVESPSRGTELT